MGSFLQRKINEQAARDGSAKQAGGDDPFADLSPSAPAPSLKPIAPKPQQPQVQVHGGAKRHTSARVAQLRKQLRPKLLAVPDEGDTWERSDVEKQQLLVGRLRTILDKGGMQISPAEFDELKEALLDDLL